METLEEASLVLYPALTQRFELSAACLAEPLLSAVLALVANEGALRLQQLSAGVSAWDGEARVTTRHADLQQVSPLPVVIFPSSWTTVVAFRRRIGPVMWKIAT